MSDKLKELKDFVVKRSFVRLNEEEKNYIKEYFSDKSVKEISEYIGCDRSTIYRAAMNMNVTKHERWTKERAELFLKLYNENTISHNELATAFDIRRSCVRYFSIELSKKYGLDRKKVRRPSVLPKSELMEIIEKIKNLKNDDKGQ